MGAVAPPGGAAARRGNGASKGQSLGALAAIARLRVVQIVLVMSIGIFFFNHGLSNWLPEILALEGHEPGEAGFWAAIPTVVGVLGLGGDPASRGAGPARRHTRRAVPRGGICASLLLQLAPGIGLATGLVLQGVARSSMMTIAICC